MNEADILALTYLDTCQVMRMQDVENPETDITHQEYALVEDNPSIISCALSQGNMDGLAVIQSDEMLNVTKDNYKLFVRPTIDIVKGDLIEVTQGVNGRIVKLYASQPFYYPSHCEVDLTGRDPNG